MKQVVLKMVKGDGRPGLEGRGAAGGLVCRYGRISGGAPGGGQVVGRSTEGARKEHGRSAESAGKEQKVRNKGRKNPDLVRVSADKCG